MHINKLNDIKHTFKLEVVLHKAVRNDNLHRLSKDAELKMIMFLHEHNLTFLLMEHLPSFVRSVCPDLKIAENIKCSRTKATAITKDCLALEAKEEICRLVKNNSLIIYSLIIDEITNIGTEKLLAIIIRFFDEKKMSVADKFLGLIKLETANAENIYKTVLKCLEDVGISLANIIGLAADNASVMMGNIRGIQARFRKMVPHSSSGMYVTHFIFVRRQISCQNLLKTSRGTYIIIFQTAVKESRS